MTQLGLYRRFLKDFGVRNIKSVFCKTVGLVDLNTLSQYGPVAGSFANGN